MDSAIEFENVQKTYGNHLVLNELSFSVEKGNKHGLIGINGSGKSSTLKILLGLTEADSGLSKVLGAHSQQITPKLYSQIGYLPEYLPLIQECKVFEYLELVKKFKGFDDKEFKKFNEFFDLQVLYKKKIENLSRGQKQLLGLAQAIINGPSLLILDEPGVNLDPQNLIKLREYLKSLSEAQTLIVSGHRLDELEKICDDFTFIHQGKKVVLDNQQEVRLVQIACQGFSLETLKNDSNYRIVSQDVGTLSLEVLNDHSQEDVFKELTSYCEGVSEFSWKKLSLEDQFRQTLYRVDS